ncbi:MAG: NUMOD4 domain-containing protein, partial [Desulfobulbaceae bacterium]|nr:NUMOD4 domain-containing protein [Desulfobulbaceae bacterium]
MEIWKPVPEFEDRYEVSNLGLVRSLERESRGRVYQSRILMGNLGKTGYSYFIAQRNHTKKTIKIHRLVCQVFCENPSRKNHVNHIDGIKTNNRWDNLEWVTPKENSNHARENGLQVSLKGGDAKTSLLSNDQANQVRVRIIAGENPHEIAMSLGINRATIYDIRHGRKYLNSSTP